MDAPKHLRKTLLVAVYLSMIPLFVMAVVLGYEFHSAYVERSLIYLSKLAQKHAQDISIFLVISVMETIARTTSIDKLTDSSYLGFILSSIRDHQRGVFVDIGLADENGLEVAYSGFFSRVVTNYRDIEWFRET